MTLTGHSMPRNHTPAARYEQQRENRSEEMGPYGGMEGQGGRGNVGHVMNLA